MQCHCTRTILRKKNMGQRLFEKYSKFQNFDELCYCGMTKNTILNYCVLCWYMKANKLKKIVRQSIFKNHLKFQKFNFKIFYCDMTKCGHKQQKVFRKDIYTKTTVRNKIIWQENFRKCSTCHWISEYFNGW